MYEEIYSELEKVRTMLVTQYDINEKMKEEVRVELQKCYVYLNLTFN